MKSSHFDLDLVPNGVSDRSPHYSAFVTAKCHGVVDLSRPAAVWKRPTVASRPFLGNIRAVSRRFQLTILADGDCKMSARHRSRLSLSLSLSFSISIPPFISFPFSLDLCSSSDCCLSGALIRSSHHVLHPHGYTVRACPSVYPSIHLHIT